MKVSRSINLAYSPCPNDTFIFYALTHHHTSTRGFHFNTHLSDVETLNQEAQRGCFDVCKLSYHALAYLLEDYCLLHSGSALGRGCGPLIVARDRITPEELPDKTIAVPGELTTAHLLLKLFAPAAKHITFLPFEQIMPAVAGGSVDVGVIIHESRFTYPLYKLKEVADLGEWWEEETGKPIPLGCMAAKRNLGSDTIHSIDESLRESIEYAMEHPTAPLQYAKQHAQELTDKVLQAHINLYVNKYTLNLGREGIEAVNTLFQLARRQKVIPETDKPLFTE